MVNTRRLEIRLIIDANLNRRNAVIGIVMIRAEAGSDREAVTARAEEPARLPFEMRTPFELAELQQKDASYNLRRNARNKILRFFVF